MGKLAAAAAVGVAGFGASQADASMIVDVRATAVNGQPVADAQNVVVSPGDVVTLRLFATVSGLDTVDNESMAQAHGSLVSTGNLLGNLTGGTSAEFSASGSQNGSNIDIDNDGDLDIGTIQNGGAGTSYFLARAPGQVNGTRVGAAAEEFHIGNFTFTAGQTGTQTLVNFLPRLSATGANTSVSAVWVEDGGGKAPTLSPYRAGDSVLITVPEPTGLALAGLVGIGLLGRRRNSNA